MYDSVDLDDLATLVPPCARQDKEGFAECLQRPPASKWCTSRVRRACDVAIALAALALFTIPMLLIAIGVRCTSPGKSLFRQKRMGRGGRLFEVFKFRTMTERRAADHGPGLTCEGDVRVTPCGRILRSAKLDELPQFFNVLKGDMSVVGPRPKLPQFAGIPNMPYRPGITGLASLAFRFEDQILARVVPERLESFYQDRIKPLKANLDVCYMCKATPLTDLRMILATFATCVVPDSLPRLLGYTRGRAGFARAASEEDNAGD